jgi:predicted porin
MKKLLIASAALAMVAGTAQAQSSVTVYGVMDIGYSASQLEVTQPGVATATTKQTTTGNGDGGLATSRLGFRGTEDLGGGNKANFQLEYDLVDVGVGGQQSAETSGLNTGTSTAQSAASGFGVRYSWVGFESKDMGQLRLGRQEQSIHSVVVAGSAGMANNVVGAVYSSAGPAMRTELNGTVAANGAQDVRPHAVFVDRAVTYISPNFNGFSFEAQTAQNKLSTGTAATDASVKETGASLKYAAGKLALAYGQATNKQDRLSSLGATGTDIETKSRALSGSYDLGVVKLFALRATRDNLDNAVSIKDENTEIGAQMPMGKTMLWASTYDGKRNFGANGNKFDSKGYQVGARYDMSKRTALYAIYGMQEFKGTGATAGNQTEATQTSVGVRHSF